MKNELISSFHVILLVLPYAALKNGVSFEPS